MISMLRFLLLASGLLVSTLATEHHQDEDPEENPGLAFRVIKAMPLPCEEKCELRMEDGKCKVDLSCLFSDLFLDPKFPAASSAAAGSGDGSPSTAKRKIAMGDNNGLTCEGKCLFIDKEDNCRLDFICMLDRDVEGTLRYLVDAGVDAETSILLALSASSKPKAEGEYHGKRCKKHLRPAPAPCDAPCLYRDVDGICKHDKNCVPSSTHAGERVVVVPHLPCPGKCEVRDPKGNCMVDYDCMNNA